MKDTSVRPSGTVPVALVAIALTVLAGCGRPLEPAERVQPVYVSSVANEGTPMTRVFTGVLNPRVESELGLRAGGRIAARLVDLGQRVRQGQALVRLDAADYVLAVEAAAEQLRAADVDAVQSASDAARFRRLAADGSIGAAELERQQARADAAAARVEQARRQLELARNKVGHATLVAPFDGVVTAVRAEVGQVVAEGQPVLALARPGELEVVADVPESMAADLSAHRAAALPNQPGAAPLRLRLRELSPAATPQSRTFRARYAIVGAGGRESLRQGMTAQLRLEREDSVATALLPISALLSTEGVATVWLFDAGAQALRRQPVEVVTQSGEAVRVRGLPDGAQVVSVGAHLLDEGMKVRPVRRPLDALREAPTALPVAELAR